MEAAKSKAFGVEVEKEQTQKEFYFFPGKREERRRIGGNQKKKRQVCLHVGFVRRTIKTLERYTYSLQLFQEL